MQLVELYDLYSTGWRSAGWTTLNNISRFLRDCDSYLKPQPGYTIIELICKEQIYVDNCDVPKIKEFFNEVIC